MFVLGHVGIGTRMLGPLRRRLDGRALVVGCLLPDLVDKPLFYGLLWLHGARLWPILGSRSIGHSLLFLAALFLLRRWSLAAGVATHFVLDIVGELVTGADPQSSIWLALFWPALGWAFPAARFNSPLEHLHLSLENLYVVAGEVVGGAILLVSRIRSRPS